MLMEKNIIKMGIAVGLLNIVRRIVHVVVVMVHVFVVDVHLNPVLMELLRMENMACIQHIHVLTIVICPVIDLVIVTLLVHRLTVGQEHKRHLFL
jgi:hypothetical protein